MNSLLLFVYGTLMRGGCRHYLLADQCFLGTARTAPRYALYDLGNYPGLVASVENGTSIQGEFYEIDPALLPRLDVEEGVPALYRRDEVELLEVARPVFTYFYQRDVSHALRLEAGRWQTRK
jgi:gamma-glutamylaminecyclotransferase